MRAASLSELSNETILQILSHFCLHCQDEYSEAWDARPLRLRHQREKQDPDSQSWYSLNRHALFSLSLVSKRFCSLAQNVMYHEFVLGYGDSWRSKLYSWDNRLESFMRTIALRPDLARLVKIVYIHSDLLEHQDIDARKAIIQEASLGLGIDLPTALRRRVPNALDNIKSFEAFLISFLDLGGDLNARSLRQLDRLLYEYPLYGRRWLSAELVALLIAQVPNLDRLSIQGGLNWPNCGLPDSALPALNISSLSLKMLDLGLEANSLVVLARDLQSLNIDCCIFWAPSSPMPSLKKVRITKGRLESGTLKDLLAACTGGLVAFEYEAGPFEIPGLTDRACGYGSPYPNYHFRHLDAIKYLESHKRTLKILHLDLTEQIGHICPMDENLDLKGFTVLEHLLLDAFIINKAPIPSQALIRLIPPSILSLAIRDDLLHNPAKTALIGLAELQIRQPSQFASLRHVRYGKEQRSSTLYSLFSEVSIDFDAGCWSLSEFKPYLEGFEGFMDTFPIPGDTDDDL